ncbi:MAG: hypothetical protein WD052_04450 [Bacteroidales bacterium]
MTGKQLENYNYGYDPVADQTGTMLDHFNQADHTPLHGYRLMIDYTRFFEKGLETRAYNDAGEQIFFQETTYFRYGPIAELGIVYSYNMDGKMLREAKSEFGSKEF